MDVTIRFRATSEEKGILEAGARRAGLSLSEWMRGVLLSASGDISHVEGSPEPEAVSEVVAKALPKRAEPTIEQIGVPLKKPTAIEVHQTTGGFVRREEIPVPDWAKEPVPQRSGFTPVPKKGKK